MLLPDDRRPRNLLLKPPRFCPYSLGDWIRVCERAQIPHVPAMHVADFERHDLLQHEYEGPHQERLDAAYEHVRRADSPDWMLRWDCCASADLKFSMSEGRKPDARIRHALPIDCRLLEILEDYPRVLVPVWRRPWIGNEMLFLDGYPVEYRAFVESGKLTGISSYYPQHRLPRNDEHLAAVERHVATLIDALEPPFEWPAEASEQMRVNAMRIAHDEQKAAARGPLQNEIHFTADFAATRLGMVLLEGGPPHFMGAHPCCFPAGGINGVALEAHEEQPDPAENPT